jgi:hypothetical protein
MCHSCVYLKMKWLLKLPFDQNLIVINYKLNGDLKSHLIFRMDTRVTHNGFLELLHFLSND